jgi:3-hydroxyisobutyrate dehydrogenase-like beta-hydroxyacid dehydrogenase
MSVSHKTIGILHPGSMGAAVGRQAIVGGARVLWLPHGRGSATVQRAEAAGLEPAADLFSLAEACGVIISVCPPAAAVDVAEQVAQTPFRGIYVDANAISPERTQYIAALLSERGITVVDGGIVGPPPRWPGGATWLYLSGPDRAVRQVNELFAGSPLEPVLIAGPVGRASALKLAFASYHKLSYVLAAQSYALAHGHGVLDELVELAGRVLPQTPLGRPDQLVTAGPRAWRWAPEMREIAEACQSAGISADYLGAAAATLERWTVHKDDNTVSLEQLIADLQDLAPHLRAVTDHPQAG